MIKWTTYVDERDYALAVREWIEVGRKGFQFVINNIKIANELKEAHLSLRLRNWRIWNSSLCSEK